MRKQSGDPLNKFTDLRRNITKLSRINNGLTRMNDARSVLSCKKQVRLKKHIYLIPKKKIQWCLARLI